MSGKNSEAPPPARVTPGGNSTDPPAKDRVPERNYTLSKADAAAGAPFDASVCGEEDPGGGLEFLVKELRSPDKPQYYNGDKHDK